MGVLVTRLSLCLALIGLAGCSPHPAATPPPEPPPNPSVAWLLDERAWHQREASNAARGLLAVVEAVATHTPPTQPANAVDTRPAWLEVARVAKQFHCQGVDQAPCL